MTTNYTLDPIGLAQVLIETAGGQSNTYLPGLAQYSGNAWAYYLPDRLGSVRQIVDPSAAVRLAQSYDPFGNVLEQTGAGQSVFGYTGEQTDPTGLVFLRARYYNPAVGRFLTADLLIPDPLHSMSWNRYAYANNNPVRYVDPSGRCGIPTDDQLDPDSGGGLDDCSGPKAPPSGGGGGIPRGGAGGGGGSAGGTGGGGGSLLDRVNEIHRQLDPIAQGQRTTAIIRVTDRLGRILDLVASSEIRLTRAQRSILQQCEVPVKGMPGSKGYHAEQRALDYANFMGYQPIEGAASRPICSTCAARMFNEGAIPVSPLE